MKNVQIYARTIEEEALEQIEDISNSEAFINSKIAIMPDTHAGKGTVIGFTANITDKVVPNVVGVDIGCGMLVASIGNVDINLEEFDKELRRRVATGVNVNDTRTSFDMSTMDYLTRVQKERFEFSIGSLGGGNHFIEIAVNPTDGRKYIVIHSGSRGLGVAVAKHHQNIAIERLNERANAHKGTVQDIIAQLRAEGREQEIMTSINEYKANMVQVSQQEKDMAYLEGEEMERYLADQELAVEYATLNRKVILGIILDILGIERVELMFETIHNYIDENRMVRKGAVRAERGQLIIIPLNMRDGSLIAVGRGNEEWNKSAPHGAGRLMSRKKAKENISMEDFKNSMTGIYTSSVAETTLDESCFAYKNSSEIEELIHDTAAVVGYLKPLYNFKDLGR